MTILQAVPGEGACCAGGEDPQGCRAGREGVTARSQRTQAALPRRRHDRLSQGALTRQLCAHQGRLGWPALCAHLSIKSGVLRKSAELQN